MTKEKQLYSGKDFGDALLRRQISPAQFARSIGLSPSTVSQWGKGGVPVKHQRVVKNRLDATELRVHGAHHQDMFPESVKGQL